MLCFLIVKDLSGAVATMGVVYWDWGIQYKKTKQRQEECIGQCLWTSKAMLGLGGESERRIGAGPHNINQFPSEKQQSFWNCCCCRREFFFFNVSGQTRKYFHLWEQWVWAAGIGRQD